MTFLRPLCLLAVVGCAVAAPPGERAAMNAAALRLAQFTHAMRIEHQVPTWGSGPVYIVQLWRDSVWELYSRNLHGGRWQRAVASHDSALFLQVAQHLARSGLFDYAGTSLAQRGHGHWQFRASVPGTCAGLTYSHPLRVHWSPYPVDAEALTRSVEELEAMAVALVLAVEWTPDTVFVGDDKDVLRQRYVECVPP